MAYRKLITSIVLLNLLAACATSQKSEPAQPEFAVPNRFESTTEAGVAIESGWLKTFNDQRLNKLVAEVLAKNFDLQIAAAKVDAAASSAKQAGAALKPVVNASIKGSNQGNVKAGGNESTVGASLDVSWELDVWGRLKSGQDAASKELQATQLDYDYAKLSLAAQTAKAYFLAIETGRQLHLSESNVANYDETKNIVDAFFEEGVVGIQDVHLAKVEQARANDSLESARAANIEALRSLEALLGRYPSAKVDVATKLPNLPPPVAAGIPSSVLERRPDIVAAEQRVAASFDKINEAKTAKLPKISLTGSLGGSGVGLSDILNPTNLIWNVISSVMFPIFNGGDLDAKVDAATASQKQSLANYQKTALKAFGDIETALTNETIYRKRYINLDTAYQSAKQAEDIGVEKYKSGETDLLDVQQLQRSSISAKGALLKVQHDLLVQRVNLYLGLGGEV